MDTHSQIRIERARETDLIWYGFAALAVVIGAWLRWRYLREISLHVDEFTTLWAATRIQELGFPRMPSGVLYTRGLLNSYVEAAFLQLFGFGYTVGRLPGLLFGLATVLLTFVIGQRIWNLRTGALAAAGLALLPEAIIWGGRARFYTQLQFFTLCTIWAAFRLIVGKREEAAAGSAQRIAPTRPALFVIAFCLALFSQEETVLLYPAIPAAMFLWRGWRFLLQPPILIANLVCIAAMAGRYLIEIVGQPGYFETIQETRPYFGLIFDVQGAWSTYAPLLVGWTRLPWTILMLIAIATALLPILRRRRPTKLPYEVAGGLFFAWIFAFVLLVILTLVGTTWREARYLFLIQPLWLLAAAGALFWLIDRLPLGAKQTHPSAPDTRGRANLIISLLAALGLVLLFVPGASATLEGQVEGYDRVLAWVAEERQSDDIVLSPQPPACALVLGPCDYYAAQRGYEEFVIADRTTASLHLVDRWSGATLLNDIDQLERLLDSGETLWFVTDSFRLATRYEPQFVRTVVEHFEIAHHEQGVLALRAKGRRATPERAAERTFVPPLDFSLLALSGWERAKLNDTTSLQRLSTLLIWEPTETATPADLNVSLRLIAEDGTPIAQADGPPANGMIGTNLIFGPTPDFKELELPPLAEGRYRFEVIVYGKDSTSQLPKPIDWLQVGPQPALAVDAEVAWSNGIHLIGHDPLPAVARRGESIGITTAWRIDRTISHDLTLFVHLVAADGDDLPAAQADHVPAAGFLPTSIWRTQGSVQDNAALKLPEDMQPGEYEIRIGWYDLVSAERLPSSSGGDSYRFGVVTVE